MKRGFTIIELLVVISIIGLIASVAMANLESARDSARIAAGKQFHATLQRTLGVETIGRWEFDEGNGTIAYDSSGNGIDGTIVGATYVESDIDSGYALYFDGNDYITGGGFPSAETDNLTIAAWIKPTDIASQNTLFNVGDSGCATYQTSIVGGKASVALSATIDAESSAQMDAGNNVVEDNAPASETTDDRIVSNNELQNVAFIYDADSVDIYINGSKRDTLQRSTANCSSEEWAIGASPVTSFGQGFRGVIDSVQAYGTSFSAEQVSQLYEEGLKKYKTILVKN